MDYHLVLDDVTKKAMEHFSVDEIHGPYGTCKTDRLVKFAPLLIGLTNFKEKFRAIVDYDPEYEFALLRVLEDPTQ